MDHLLHLKCIISLFIISNQIVTEISGQTSGDDHSQSPLSPGQDPTYLRIIYNDSTEAYYRNHECPDGIWQENVKGLNPTVACICVKGVYAVSSTLCDDYFQILTGNEHCFSLDRFKPRKFFPLLGKMGFRGRASTVFREDGPYFARLVSLSPNNYVDDNAKYILRVNDPNIISVYQNDGDAAYGLKCIPGQNIAGKSISQLEQKPVIQIAELPKCANEFWGEQSWCSTAGNVNYNWAIDVGKSWAQNTKSGKSGIAYNGKCSGAPSLDPPPDIIDNIKVAKRWPACDTVDNKKYRQDSTAYRTPNPFVVDMTNMTKNYREKPNWHPDSQHQITTNEMTRKVAKDLVAFAMGKGPVKLPTVNLTVYKYLQHSKLIFLKKCPTEGIPVDAVNYLIRIFRLLLIESEKIQSFREDIDSGLNDTIIKTLTDCAAAIKGNNKMFQNCTEEALEITPEGDPPNTPFNVSLYYANRTAQNRTLPPDLVFNTGDLSFPIELAWKLMAHTHYFCSEFFRTGYEHSYFQAKVEALLTTPPLLYQWRHPGASLQVFQLLTSRYNLVDLAEKVDRCVAIARANSTYSEWIKRPADFIAMIPKSRKKRYHFSNNIWESKAFCLSHSDELRSEVTTYHEGLCAKEPIYYKNTD